MNAQTASRLPTVPIMRDSYGTRLFNGCISKQQPNTIYKLPFLFSHENVTQHK